MNQVIGLYNYWIVIFLMMTGFYIVIARSNLIQKVIGLNIFQISVFLLYITMGKISGGTAPILQGHAAEHAAVATESALHDDSNVTKVEVATSHGVSENSVHDAAQEASHGAPTDNGASQVVVYSHPLPSVLMLTAIVVGVATTAVALALIIRIGEAYGTIEEDEILQLDRRAS